MKSFKTRSNPSALSALTLAVFALVHGAASAAASDDDLKKTKLYGDVSIADDSSSSWGPWSNFEPPAAGPATGSNEPIKRTVEMYRPLAQPVSPSVPAPVVAPIGLGCAGGSLCGFGVFAGNDTGTNNHYTEVAPHAWMATGTAIASNGSALPASIELHMTSLSEGATLLMPDSGTLLMNGMNNGGMYVTYQLPANPNSRYQVSGSTDQYLNYMAEVTQVASVYINIDQYVRGNSGGETQFSSHQGSWGYGVLGFTTPDADMAALRANNATASYDGLMFGNGGGSVHFDVKFGPATWKASINGGQDGPGVYTTMVGGNAYLHGAVGADLIGTISGVNLTTTGMSAKDGVVSGRGFTGAALGPQAAAIAGVVDITKTTAASVSSTAYTNATLLAPVVAVKSSLLRSTE